MNDSDANVGLVLSGGGARAAYRVGVLQAVARMLPRAARRTCARPPPSR
jgi:predicted acylesterase/phospholipase RssA